VFLARRVSDGREVALKLGALGAMERFQREAEALRRLGSPDVPVLFEAGEVEGRPFLVMERLHGETLGAWMARLPANGAAPWLEAVQRAQPLAEVLGRVHAAGLVHRDLKPENVFLRTGGEVALLDFGLARMRQGEPGLALTTAGQRLGTVHYMAPEQCQDAHQVDARADVYALGIILFELLTGRPPFVGEAAEVAQGHLALRPPRPSSLVPVPPEVEALVLRCLAKEPRARFEDGAALARALIEVREVVVQGAASSTAQPASVAASARASEPFTASSRRVVLLGVGLRAPAHAVLGRAAPEGGALGRLQGERCLVSFHEHPSPVAGLRAAARTARGLLGAGLIHEAVLHVAELRVRPGRTGTRLVGTALEQPESWWVEAPSSSVALTPEAAALLASHEVVSAAPGRFVLAEQPTLAGETDTRAEGLPLVGREELVAELLAAARQALAESVPCLSLLEGDVGVGKTRLMATTAEALSQEGVHVLSFQAPAPDAAQEPLSVQLGRALGSPAGAGASSLPDGGDAAAHLSARLRELARERPLALLVDDAHQADPLCLDALERATLSGARLPLWVCLASRPELRTVRPHLGDRAARHTSCSVSPLPGPAARTLLRELLRPVEFVPEPALAHLESLAQGNPLALVELVRALREAGAVRTDPLSGAWMLAPDELPREALAAPFEPVVRRTRDTLPHLSRLFASLCAVLGEALSVEEVEAAQRELEPGDEALRELAMLDAGAGLARLVRAGVLRAPGPGRYTFRHRMLRDALEADTPAPLRRALHRAALRALMATADLSPTEGRGPTHLRRRVAEHAAACGEHLTAARAFLALGEHYRASHRDMEAEQAYTAALAQLPEHEHGLREQVLGGRGRVRGRTQRFREALEDLTAARALAEARGDDAAVVDLLLEEATLNDWLEQPDATRQAAEQAFLREERVSDARLRLRCALARGRHHARAGEFSEAVQVLGAVAAEAERLGDWDSEAISRVVLGVSLSFLGELAQAAACFEELISRSRARGDLLHLASAHNSRVLLWLRQQSVEPALGDLQRTVELARELGHAQLERIASFNLAEVLHWLSREAEALPYARRALALGERFFGNAPMALEAVLVARIAAASGAPSLAHESLAWVERHVPPDRLGPVTRAQVGLVRQLLAQASRAPIPEDLDAWQRLLDEAAPHASDDELLELLLHALTTALTAGQPSRAHVWWREAHTRMAGAPHWKPRLDPLEPRLD
jgi:tetratricopeptide (TPR) repeat protein